MTTVLSPLPLQVPVNKALTGPSYQVGDYGLYVGRPVMNHEQLRRWAARQGLELVPDPHVTIVYSHRFVELGLAESQLVIDPDKIERIGPLGDNGAIVMFLDAPALTARWAEARLKGASSTYGGTYVPHLTLAYVRDADPAQPGFQYEERQVDRPDFPIILGPEAAGYVHQDVWASLFMDPAPKVWAPWLNAPLSISKSQDGGADRRKQLREELEARTPHTIEALRRGLSLSKVEKLNDPQRLVSGWIYPAYAADGRPYIDRQKHCWTLREIAKSAATFMSGSRDMGFIHMRVSEDKSSPKIRIGEFLESLVVTPVVKSLLGLPAHTPFGWAGTGRVDSDVAWQAVLDGKLPQFSVAGLAHEVPVLVQNATR